MSLRNTKIMMLLAQKNKSLKEKFKHSREMKHNIETINADFFLSGDDSDDYCPFSRDDCTSQSTARINLSLNYSDSEDFNFLTGPSTSKVEHFSQQQDDQNSENRYRLYVSFIERYHVEEFIPLTCVQERVATALGISIASVKRVKSDDRSNPTLSSPGKKRSRKKSKSEDLPESSKMCIRNTLYIMYTKSGFEFEMDADKMIYDIAVGFTLVILILIIKRINIVFEDLERRIESLNKVARFELDYKLLLACNNNDILYANFLLDCGASVHTITQRGDTPLLMCMRKSPPNASNIKLIERLLALGCDFEKANNEGVSPLQVAVKAGNLKLINLLVNKYKEK
ncbi:hypothetical protein FQR65_LT16862 [Abscondita terminalis]|nr:hypothetical protein FQR65_LT16862 [Abscondita terminalis]